MNQIPNRNIEVRIQAEKGFASGKIKIIQDLAVVATIKRLPVPSLDTCDLEIMNMRDEDTQVLTTLNYNPSKLEKNTLEVYAGEDGVYSRVFKGDIIRGSSTYGGDAKFTASCQTNYFIGLRQMRPISIKGRENITTLMSKVAQEANLQFINKGVAGITIKDPILDGSPIEQLQYLAKISNIDIVFTDDEVRISKKNVGTTQNPIKVNVNNGLLSYPTIDELGINIQVKFQRNFIIGEIIEVTSLNTKANGLWKVFEASVALSNYDAMWETQLRARKF